MNLLSCQHPLRSYLGSYETVPKPGAFCLKLKYEIILIKSNVVLQHCGAFRYHQKPMKAPIHLLLISHISMFSTYSKILLLHEIFRVPLIRYRMQINAIVFGSGITKCSISCWRIIWKPYSSARTGFRIYCI